METHAELGKSHATTLSSMSNLARYVDASGDFKQAILIEQDCFTRKTDEASGVET